MRAMGVAQAWREALQQGLLRARRLDRPVVVTQRESLVDAPDLLELFASAETRGQRRFLAARPSDGFALLALGVSAEILSLGSEPFSDMRERARALLHAADPGALLLGGFAFVPLPQVERSSAWRSRANARFVLPALLLARDASGAWLTRIARVHPAESEAMLVARCERSASELLKRPQPVQARPLHLDAPSDGNAASQYAESAAEIIAAIRRGEADKVVLARAERLPLAQGLTPASVLRQLSIFSSRAARRAVPGPKARAAK